MMGLADKLPKTSCTNLVWYLSLATFIVGISGQTVTTCPLSLIPPSSITKNGLSYAFCQEVQILNSSPAATYNVWYKRDNTTTPTTLSVILSVPYFTDHRWYGMGFNPAPSSMKGTSAIIFWVNPTSGKYVSGTYTLTEEDPGGVNIDNSSLTYTSGHSPVLQVVSSNLYLTFEVEQATPADFANQNFVISNPGDIPSGDVITGSQTTHQGVSPVSIDFQSGTGFVTELDPLANRRRTHGLLNVIGWGVLLPIGAIIARYARGLDPHWFYMHAVCQIVGYGLIMAGLITGSKLLDLSQGLNADTHKDLAIFLFVLATIQISAVLIRPKKEAKVRRYWNWGHWWLGRIALVIGAVNIFVGIHLASAGRKWKVGYGIALGIEISVALILEILLWVKYFRSKDQPRLPQTAMQNRATNGASAPPPGYETNWDGKP